MDLRLPNFDRDHLCHFGGGGSSAPAGAYSNSKQGASVYMPTNQPGADQQFQDVLAGFPTTPGATPAGTAYPQAQNAYAGFIDPYAAGGNAGYYGNQAIQSANDAYNTYRNGPLQNAITYSGLLEGAGGNLLNQSRDLSGQLSGVPGQLLNTAFDPRQELYGRTLNQLQQQLGVQAANSGVTGTPYAAGSASDALRNFNIDWQNQQLQRELQGAAGAGNTLAQQLGLLTSGAAGAGNAFTQGNALAGNASQLLAQLGGLGYGASTNVGSNALQGLGSLTNLGNQQYVLPQQVLNDLQSYLGLGQAASQVSGNLGNLGLQQQGNALSGIGSAIGLGNSLLGNPLSGVGSSIGSALGFGGAGLGAGLGAFDAGGTLGIGALDAASQLGPGIGASVGSGSILDALPFAASA